MKKLPVFAFLFSIALFLPYSVAANESARCTGAANEKCDKDGDEEGHDHGKDGGHTKGQKEGHGDGDEDGHEGHEKGQKDGAEQGKKEDAHGGHEEGAGHSEGHEGGGEAGHEGLIELEWESATKEGVTFVTAGPADVKETLALNGEISLNEDSVVHVSPRFPGVLKRVEKNLGDDVKAGELLAVVQSNESLSVYEIRAEVPGTVIEKDATRGEFVRDDKNLFTIADLGSVWVNAAVYPDALKNVKIGRTAIISSRSSDLTQKANISYLRLSLSEISRTALARVVLTNTAREWIPGMFVKVSVLLDSLKVPLAVPATAIQAVENKPIVFVKTKSPDNEEAFQKRNVTVGRSDGERTEILQGLKAGEEVASGNTFILKAELGKGSAEHSH